MIKILIIDKAKNTATADLTSLELQNLKMENMKRNKTKAELKKVIDEFLKKEREEEWQIKF